MKRKLNLKVQIPSDQLCKWRRHTWLTNPTKKVPFHLSHAFDLEYCTKAFLKLYEILHRFPNLIPPVPRLGKPFRLVLFPLLFSYVDSLSSVVSLSVLWWSSKIIFSTLCDKSFPKPRNWHNWSHSFSHYIFCRRILIWDLNIQNWFNSFWNLVALLKYAHDFPCCFSRSFVWFCSI